MLTEYIKAAMQSAVYEYLPDDRPYYGEIPGLHGVWANSETFSQCRTELREVLEDWLLLGLRLGHDIPSIDGISLESVKGQ
ncbi:MAG: type II toxin-antitoxin system HicB family antitoxin [Dehalococcoidia bacterium]|nr:type II toxin-antitoxin system HicB family antitoxin [Chloroflexota bacterium]MXY42905.1 type II toxin-antitoxin system HicB family antitoxin [Dehalococcoidia bacterium]